MEAFAGFCKSLVPVSWFDVEEKMGKLNQLARQIQVTGSILGSKSMPTSSMKLSGSWLELSGVEHRAWTR